MRVMVNLEIVTLVGWAFTLPAWLACVLFVRTLSVFCARFVCTRRPVTGHKTKREPYKSWMKGVTLYKVGFYVTKMHNLWDLCNLQCSVMEKRL